MSEVMGAGGQSDARKRSDIAAFRRKATYFKNHPGTRLQEGLGLSIDEMNEVLRERGLGPVSDEDQRRWARKRSS
jgi:hypothetical protein